MTTELTTIEHNGTGSALAPLTARDIRAQVNLIQEVMKEVMTDGVHFGKVPGCGDKPTLLQPGAHKLMMTFRLVPDPEMTIVEMDRGHREVRCKVKIYSQGGVLLGAGVGTCSTLEGKYRYRTGPVEFTDKPVPREYWDLRSTNPAKAKAMLGEGMTAKKNDAGAWVCARQGEKVEHDNPADYYNTVEKMAYKRALVSATLTVTAASDIFTQDIEDMPEVIPGAGVPPVAPTAQSTQSAPGTGREDVDDVRSKLKQAQAEQKPAESKPAESKPEESKDFTAAESKWNDMIVYMSEDPDRAKLLKSVKEKFGASSVAKLAVPMREGFLNTLRDDAKKLKMKLDL